MRGALKMYEGFHQQDPKRVGSFHSDLVIPAEAVYVGAAVHVLYRSDKLNPTTGEDEGWIDYIHEHDPGVKAYRIDRIARGLGPVRRVPGWLQDVTELVWLGHCLGYEYRTPDGDPVEAKGARPLPELYTTPNGRALLIIQSKRTMLAMLWGGRLGVEPRGIVH